MKKSAFLLSVMVFCSNVLFSQLKVLNDGKVDIGAETSSTNNLNGCLNVIQTNNWNPSSLYIENNMDCGTGLWSECFSTSPNGTVSIFSRVGSDYAFQFLGMGPSSNSTFCIFGSGIAYAQGILISSDSTLKTDIKSIQSPMQKIMNMRGVSYKFKETLGTISKNEETITQTTLSVVKNANTKSDNNPSKIDAAIMQKIADENKNFGHLGFLAQEMEKVVPEVVRTSVNGTKAIAYTDLIAILVEGMKEQQVCINKLNERITFLESEFSKMAKVN